MLIADGFGTYLEPGHLQQPRWRMEHKYNIILKKDILVKLSLQI